MSRIVRVESNEGIGDGLSVQVQLADGLVLHVDASEDEDGKFSVRLEDSARNLSRLQVVPEPDTATYVFNYDPPPETWFTIVDENRVCQRESVTSEGEAQHLSRPGERVLACGQKYQRGDHVP